MNDKKNDGLKPCPFCGGESEIYAGRTLPKKGKTTCESENEALEKLEEYRAIGTVAEYHIGPRRIKRVNMKEEKAKWGIVVEMVGYIPRCCNAGCLGRTQKMFLTEKEAIVAWNRRKH